MSPSTAKSARPAKGDLESVRLEATRDGDRLELAVDRDTGFLRFGPDPMMDLEIAVPEELEIDRVETRNGGLEVSEVGGGPTLETRNGAIDAVDVDDDLAVETRNGDVEIDGVAGDLTVDARNGAITAEAVDGALSIGTRNGEVEVGDVRGDVDVETRNGDVDIAAPSSDLALDVETDGGDVTLEGIDGVDVEGSESFRTTVGDGSRRLEVTTRNGDVTVRGEE